MANPVSSLLSLCSDDCVPLSLLNGSLSRSSSGADNNAIETKRRVSELSASLSVVRLLLFSSGIALLIRLVYLWLWLSEIEKWHCEVNMNTW